MKTTQPIASFLLAAVAAGSLGAQSATPEQSRATTAYIALDTDNDGRLSDKEAKTNPALYAQFDALDKDKDGYLTVAEYAASTAIGKPAPVDPTTLPGGSNGAQHMPKSPAKAP
jgi:hypothetical protein